MSPYHRTLSWKQFVGQIILAMAVPFVISTRFVQHAAVVVPRPPPPHESQRTTTAAARISVASTRTNTGGGTSMYQNGSKPTLTTTSTTTTTTIQPTKATKTTRFASSQSSSLSSSVFPIPRLHAHKTPPLFKYSGVCWDDPYTHVHHQADDDEDRTTTTAGTQAQWSQHRVDVHLHIADDHNPAEHQDDEHVVGEGFNGYQPAGQHVMMDLQHVDPAFLSNAQLLAHAMVETTQTSGLTLLSYHCHDLKPPMGVSCVGVLLESHVSVHTWPAAGRLSLDLFTCGPASLLPLLPLLQRLFAVPAPRAPQAPPVEVQWLYKKRGFRDYQSLFDGSGGGTLAEPKDNDDDDDELPENTEGVELEQFLLGWKGYAHKRVLVRTQTQFQEVALFEMAPSPDTPHKNKKLYLDHVAQSTLHGLEAYHEALVHPALFAHPKPRRVAIIGGGEGATLREVLKHQTVDTCVMIDIDAEFVQVVSREYLPEWHDCGDLIVPTAASVNHSRHGEEFFSCLDHPRAQVYTVDAYRWFMDRFGEQATIQEEPFDVIIMDALDPSSFVPFSDILYMGEDFIQALMHSLTPNGVLVAQVGASPRAVLLNDNARSTHVLDEFARLLSRHGAQAMKAYSEAHGQFLAPWDFRIAFKNASDSLARWHAPPAWVDVELARRAVPTRSGRSVFRYMDGAMQQCYQYPTRLEEKGFCTRTRSDSIHCQRRYSAVTPPVLPNEVDSILIMPLVFQQMESMKGLSEKLERWYNTINEHGVPTDMFGLQAQVVKTLSFMGSSPTEEVGFYDPSADRGSLLRVTSSLSSSSSSSTHQISA
ncbi:hypothetical protein ACA910_009834 [Epithemia clementina (nom. ined.)]